MNRLRRISAALAALGVIAGAGCTKVEKAKTDPAALQAEIEQSTTQLNELNARLDAIAPQLSYLEIARGETSALDSPELEVLAANYRQAVNSRQQTLDSALTSAWTQLGSQTGSHAITDLRSRDDGFFLAAGYSTNAESGDRTAFVVMCDAAGTELWRTGPGGEGRDRVRRVASTTDTGVLAVGTTSSRDFSGDLWLVKLDSTGSVEWSKTFGKSGTDEGVFAAALPDGGSLVVGRTYQGGGGMNVYLIRTTEAGEAVWEMTLNNEGDQFVNDAVILLDGALLLAGTTGSLNDNDGKPFIQRVTAEGDAEPLTVLDPPGFVNPDSVFIETAGDGDIMLAAGFLTEDKQIRAWSGKDDAEGIFLMRTGMDGAIRWVKTFGGDLWDSPRGLCVTPDGGYLIAAATSSYGAGGAEVLLIKTDEKGAQAWSRTIGDAADETLTAFDLANDGGFLLATVRKAESDDSAIESMLIKADPKGRAWRDDAPFASEGLTPVKVVVADAPPEPSAAPVEDLGPKPGVAPPEIRAEEWINAPEPVSLAGLRGKVAVVEFWATWCAPCRASIPHLREVQEKYRDRGLVILGLTDETRADAKLDEFMAELKMDYVVGIGSTSIQDYGVTGIPTAFVVGRDGILRWKGHPMDTAFESAIQHALDEL